MSSLRNLKETIRLRSEERKTNEARAPMVHPSVADGVPAANQPSGAEDTLIKPALWERGPRRKNGEEEMHRTVSGSRVAGEAGRPADEGTPPQIGAVHVGALSTAPAPTSESPVVVGYDGDNATSLAGVSNTMVEAQLVDDPVVAVSTAQDVGELQLEMETLRRRVERQAIEDEQRKSRRQTCIKIAILVSALIGLSAVAISLIVVFVVDRNKDDRPTNAPTPLATASLFPSFTFAPSELPTVSPAPTETEAPSPAPSSPPSTQPSTQPSTHPTTSWPTNSPAPSFTNILVPSGDFTQNFVLGAVEEPVFFSDEQLSSMEAVMESYTAFLAKNAGKKDSLISAKCTVLDQSILQRPITAVRRLASPSVRRPELFGRERREQESNTLPEHRKTKRRLQSSVWLASVSYAMRYSSDSEDVSDFGNLFLEFVTANLTGLTIDLQDAGLTNITQSEAPSQF